jgi:hypothetical protein
MESVEVAIFTIWETSSLLTILLFGPLAAANPRNRSSWRMNVMRSVGKYLFGLLAAAAAADVVLLLLAAFEAGFLDLLSAFSFGSFGVQIGADLGGCLGAVVVGGCLGAVVVVDWFPSRIEASGVVLEAISNLLLMFG